MYGAAGNVIVLSSSCVILGYLCGIKYRDNAMSATRVIARYIDIGCVCDFFPSGEAFKGS